MLLQKKKTPSELAKEPEPEATNGETKEEKESKVGWPTKSQGPVAQSIISLAKLLVEYL